MSRHTLHGRQPGHTVIVGYDQPLNEFFMQVWDDKDELVYAEGPLEELDDIKIHARELPDALRRTLINEAAGESDTNVIRDWRS